MPLIFTPLTEDILDGHYPLHPRTAFLMMQDNKGTPQIDSDMERSAVEVLHSENFRVLKASQIAGNKDFLAKIIDLIRGTGFGIAIFSDYTDKKAMANIFFEVAICNMLGKSVLLLKSEHAEAPSDLVRTQWISYKPGTGVFEEDLRKHLRSLEKTAQYYEILGDIAFDATDIDWDLAFERYRQSYLISQSGEVLSKLTRYGDRLATFIKAQATHDPGYQRLNKSVSTFIRFAST